MRLSLLALIPFAAFSANTAPVDLLIVWPLDTTVVSSDSGVSSTALTEGKTARRTAPSFAVLIAREFHPRFGAAIAHAARKVEVVDSSAAHPDCLAPFVAVRVNARDGDGPWSFHLPSARDTDSSRFALVISSLAFSQSSQTVARRTVPPAPPGFDPATGEMTPGHRRAYSEGPGRMTTLSAKTGWVLWDHRADTAVAHGMARGTSTFRGNARRADWDEAARELAKDVLRRTKFTPFQ